MSVRAEVNKHVLQSIRDSLVEGGAPVRAYTFGGDATMRDDDDGDDATAMPTSTMRPVAATESASSAVPVHVEHPGLYEHTVRQPERT